MSQEDLLKNDRPRLEAKARELNKSGLKPLGRAVLVKAYEPEIKAGRIVIPETVAERTQAAEMRVVVVEVGSQAWSDELAPRAEPGDKVLVTKYAGAMCQGTLDGQQYRVVNANDIFLQITGEKKLPANLTVGRAA